MTNCSGILRPVRQANWRQLITLLIVAMTILAGCGGGDDVSVSATVQDKGPIFRSLDISLSTASAVDVEYWSPGGPRLRVSSSDNAVSHTLALPRLRAESTYQYRVGLRTSAGSTIWVHAGTFTTAQLPDDLRAITFSPSGTATQPLVFLSVRSTFNGGVIVDTQGHIVWYGRTTAPQGAAQRANGNWVVLTNSLTEFNSLGEVVSTLPSTSLPAGHGMHHGVIATPANTLLFLTLDPRVFNGVTIQGEEIWEWDPQTNALDRRWRAFDFLDPTVDIGPRSVPNDWFHANHVSVGPRGNTLVSFHFLDQVISIAPGFGSIEWRLGGVGSTYTVTLDQVTSGQHSAREVAPNHVLLFDNGYARADGSHYSRALELALDPATHTVNTAWQYRPNPDIWATIISSARRVSNGNTVVTFGTPAGLVGATGPVSVHEVSASSALLWHMDIGLPAGSSVFQGDPIQSIGGETEVP
ncbi:aryl-sulfate sulfotransferase [Piscinibacter terrae]|uniref:Arylsulfotransferase (ASST) n=1 Tax=Piscinibacter terrae TaxID=2496871 RepID=A0A3N7HNA8_9BURK|nr:aryl-sulfate sulfotransferase [Albitalea terrae]RQP22161.1 hypothetical protein DZC73_24490 [Albitalea terrae]